MNVTDNRTLQVETTTNEPVTLHVHVETLDTENSDGKSTKTDDVTQVTDSPGEGHQPRVQVNLSNLS